MRRILTDGLLCVSMSLKDEENSTLKPKELIFLLAIAGRIDAQSRCIALKLDQNRSIYHAYAVLDSLSSSYSMFKYFIDVYFSRNDPDLIHDILTSPGGIAAILTETTFLVSFSLLASVFDNEEKNATKKFIAASWPYFRDVIKGLKNAYKGWRSGVQILSAISGADLKYMVIPVGVGLGIFAAANRFWLRQMVENRKKLMTLNKELFLEIQQLDSLTSSDHEYYLSRIGYQDKRECTQAFLASAAGGLIDGLYLYLGVVNLSILSPPLFITISAISIVYILACIVTRVFEEYDFQLRLAVTQTKCKFTLIIKEMEDTYTQLILLQEKENKISADLEDIKQLLQETGQLINRFEDMRQLLHKQLTYNNFTAGLLGMKYGLYAYGVLTSFLFMIASVFLVTSTAFPPALLAGFVLSGLVLMVGMAMYTLRAHYLHLRKQECINDELHPFEHLKEMKKNIEVVQDNVKILTADCFEESLKDGVDLDPSPQFFFQEWFEVLRSFASGISKGNNFSNFLATPFQDIDHDNRLMNALAITSSVLFSAVLGLRALARGLARQAKNVAEIYTKIDVVPLPINRARAASDRESTDRDLQSSSESLPRTNSMQSSPKSLPRTNSIQSLPESLPRTNSIEDSLDSIPRVSSASSLHSFFNSSKSLPKDSLELDTPLLALESLESTPLQLAV